ncbi:hypothetical protein DGI_2142 [Megalodesulfovibrio gigas DSM 1382 = ATCC 19364]|uniref:Uncharacterized protein n=1 Tax=Megalodesulfovibrio gigas (strain ATCC 19364 / DSM 1382 / NCIMB 9332 / VKM B-1759) TaxID=1121448 RepID=T2GCJ5_MEGG1|nr:hypothetical protein DGI_2142 [Megalodesulfovibrio gigas DSM 1382 = ATCC 19364]
MVPGGGLGSVGESAGFLAPVHSALHYPWPLCVSKGLSPNRNKPGVSLVYVTV